jgi:predicted dehydrogenase
MSAFGVVGTKGSMIADGSGTLRKCIDGQKEEVLDVNASSNVDLAGNIGERAGDDRVMNLAARQETPEEHFVRCVIEDREPIVTPYMARQVLEVVLAIRESAATGRAVALS